MRIPHLAPALLAIAMTAGCGGSPAADAPAPPPVTQNPAAHARLAKVYYFQGGKITPSTRTVAKDDRNVLFPAMEALLKGPTSADLALGAKTFIPAGTAINGITSQQGGMVVIDFSSDFRTGADASQLRKRIEQVVYTATSFPGVEAVDVHVDGASLQGALNRADFGDTGPGSGSTQSKPPAVLPAVVIEEPSSGERVKAKFSVSGTANVVEAMIVWEALSPSGERLDSGTTMATSGSGTRGTYTFTVDVGDTRGPIKIAVGGQDQPGSTASVSVVVVG